MWTYGGRDENDYRNLVAEFLSMVLGRVFGGIATGKDRLTLDSLS